MVDIFEEKICTICKKHNTINCKKTIIIKEEKNIRILSCESYGKDSNKIIPYIEPLIVTANRDYVHKTEV